MGLRSPARDTVLTSPVDNRNYRRVFGLERGGDNAGAIFGPLVGAGPTGV